MIATGVVKPSGGVQLYGIPDSRIPSHARVPQGRRVTIAMYGDGGPFRAPGWVLVAHGGRVGWTLSEGIQRDPLVFVDLSHHNGARPDMKRLLDDGFMAIGLKATQGTSYKYRPWCLDNAPRLVEAAGDRWGDTVFGIVYHYLTERADGVGQGYYFAKTIRALGPAWLRGSLRPVCDIEDGTDKKKLLKVIRDFWTVIRDELGQVPILYGGSLLRDLKIKGSEIDKPAPDPWVAEYASALKPEIYEAMGYDVSDVFAWQYAAGAESNTPTTPNFGKLPHAKVYDLAVKKPVGKYADTNIILGAKDLAEVKAKYGWRFAA